MSNRLAHSRAWSQCPIIYAEFIWRDSAATGSRVLPSATRLCEGTELGIGVDIGQPPRIRRHDALGIR